MTLSAHDRFRLLIAAAVIIGIGFLYLSTISKVCYSIQVSHFVIYVPEELCHLASEISRDVGIAFLVGVIVTGIYEIYARTLYDVSTITGVLRTIMGDMIRPDIWNEVKSLVIERETIRQNVKIEIDAAYLSDNLLDGAELHAIVEYELHNLRSKELNVLINHVLDFNLKDEAKNLPRFDSITINGMSQIISAEDINKGQFSKSFNIGLQEVVNVRTDRREKTYFPGTYNLIMTEITKGITLSLTGLPDDIESSVCVRSRFEPEKFEKGRSVTKDLILLPGHCIEFIFKYKEHVS